MIKYFQRGVSANSCPFFSRKVEKLPQPSDVCNVEVAVNKAITLLA